MEENGVVRNLVIQTNKMRQAVNGVSPEVVLLDTTFNFNSEGRVLNVNLKQGYSLSIRWMEYLTVEFYYLLEECN